MALTLPMRCFRYGSRPDPRYVMVDINDGKQYGVKTTTRLGRALLARLGEQQQQELLFPEEQ